MTSTPKIRGDKLVLATISVLRTLIMELDKAGAVDVSTVIAAIDGARIEIAFPPDDEPHQLHRQAVGLGMLDDQDLDRRSLLGHLRLGRLPLDRGHRLR